MISDSCLCAVSGEKVQNFGIFLVRTRGRWQDKQRDATGRWRLGRPRGFHSPHAGAAGVGKALQRGSLQSSLVTHPRKSARPEGLCDCGLVDAFASRGSGAVQDPKVLLVVTGGKSLPKYAHLDDLKQATIERIAGPRRSTQDYAEWKIELRILDIVPQDYLKEAAARLQHASCRCMSSGR